jgi:hypothetical protein
MFWQTEPDVKIRDRQYLILLLGLAVGVLSIGQPGFLAAGSALAEQEIMEGKKISTERNFKMRSFTLLVMYQEEIGEHFTIVMALELVGENAWIEVRHRIPRIRNEFYRVLLGIVTFRRKGAPIPDIEIFRMVLLKAINETYGRKVVKDILIQQAFKKAVR